MTPQEQHKQQRSRRSTASCRLTATATTFFYLVACLSSATAQLRGSVANTAADVIAVTSTANVVAEEAVEVKVERGMDEPTAVEVMSKKKTKDFGRCEGDCNEDKDCVGSLVCMNRGHNEPIFGCNSPDHIIQGNSDFCGRVEDREAFNDYKSSGNKLKVKYVRNDNNEHMKQEKDRLGECEGDCDNHSQCRGKLKCQQRSHRQGFDGCSGGDSDTSETDYCVDPKYYREDNNIFDNHVKTDDANTVKTDDSRNESPKTDTAPVNDVHNGRPWVVSTSSAYDKKAKLSLDKPRNIQPDDKLFLFLSRSDDILPLEIEGWKREASCFKQHNGQAHCITAEMCIRRVSFDDKYCDRFEGDRNGQDLATVIFSRRVSNADANDKTKGFFKLDVKSMRFHPAWAILAAVRNAGPVRGSSGVSCDASDRAIFENVNNAQDKDLLLMSFAFDDAAPAEKFRAPSQTRMVAYIVGEDETGILYAQAGLSAGPTGRRETKGDGASDCKDLNLALVVGKN